MSTLSNEESLSLLVVSWQVHADSLQKRIDLLESWLCAVAWDAAADRRVKCFWCGLVMDGAQPDFIRLHTRTCSLREVAP